MQDLPLPKRIYYRYLGHLYWFAYSSTQRSFLGLRYSIWLKLGALLLLATAWIRGWGNVALIGSFLLLMWLFLATWRAKRAGYYRFVPDRSAAAELLDSEPLAPYDRIPVTATGIFSLQAWEKSVLFRPAHYWQVPRGDHAVMVAYEPGRYLYQFFGASLLTGLERGWLLYGSQPNPALAIKFTSIWGPEFSELKFSIFGSVTEAREAKSRTIYLSFADEQTEEIVSHNILSDLREHQAEPAPR